MGAHFCVWEFIPVWICPVLNTFIDPFDLHKEKLISSHKEIAPPRNVLNTPHRALTLLFYILHGQQKQLPLRGWKVKSSIHNKSIGRSVGKGAVVTGPQNQTFTFNPSDQDKRHTECLCLIEQSLSHSRDPNSIEMTVWSAWKTLETHIWHLSKTNQTLRFESVVHGRHIWFSRFTEVYRDQTPQCNNGVVYISVSHTSRTNSCPCVHPLIPMNMFPTMIGADSWHPSTFFHQPWEGAAWYTDPLGTPEVHHHTVPRCLHFRCFTTSNTLPQELVGSHGPLWSLFLHKCCEDHTIQSSETDQMISVQEETGRFCHLWHYR